MYTHTIEKLVEGISYLNTSTQLFHISFFMADRDSVGLSIL